MSKYLTILLTLLIGTICLTLIASSNKLLISELAKDSSNNISILLVEAIPFLFSMGVGASVWMIWFYYSNNKKKKEKKK